MNSITISVDDAVLEKMKNFYSDKATFMDEGAVLFRAEEDGCMITARRDKRILFKGNNAKKIADRWQAAKKPVQEMTSGMFMHSHIGSDDVGNNDYFGPICTVACYVDEKDIDWLVHLDIHDVKTLPNQEVIRLARLIKDKLKYSLLILDNPHYNKMVNEGLNPANIKARLHNQAITNVIQRIDGTCQTKVIEHFVSPKTFYNYLKNEVIVVKDLKFETDSYNHYLAMSCAHLLARYASLQYFNNMSRKLNTRLPYGSTAAVDRVAVELVLGHGEAILNKVAKKHFTNTKRVLDEARQKAHLKNQK